MGSRALTRAESKERTRMQLLDAAAQVLQGHGYRGATVEQIAAEAGYTIGALYANFDGKDDLLYALLEREVAGVVERVAGAADAAEGGIAAALRRGAEEWIAILDADPELYVLLIELWTLWVRDSELRPVHAQRFTALRRVIGERIAEQLGREGASMRMPVEEVGAVVVALADGLAIQRLADPEALSDDLLARQLEALVPVFADRSR